MVKCLLCVSGNATYIITLTKDKRPSHLKCCIQGAMSFSCQLGLRNRFHERLFTSLNATQILHTSSVKLVQDTLTFKARGGWWRRISCTVMIVPSCWVRVHDYHHYGPLPKTSHRLTICRLQPKASLILNTLLIARRRLRGHACLYPSSRPEWECRWQRVENREFAEVSSYPMLMLWWWYLMPYHKGETREETTTVITTTRIITRRGV